jgi:hypothetical protein
MLHNIRLRYQKDLIYTATGPILIAMNPFKWLKIYGSEQVELYHRAGLGGRYELSSLPPHCFTVAELALDEVRCHFRSSSVIICGESGAGKTETTKLILSFMSQVASSGRNEDIAERIMESNPLMEAFGNAKTVRNHNSSRFGKFVRVFFREDGLDPQAGLRQDLQSPTKLVVAGAVVDNYLLETSRVVAQASGERGFHIFFQALLHAPEADLVRWGMCDSIGERRPPQSFRVLERSSTDLVADKDGWQETKDAFDTLRFSDAEVDAIMSVVGSVLRLGNCMMVPYTPPASPMPSEPARARRMSGGSMSTTCVAEEDYGELKTAARLLGVAADDLEHALTVRQIHTADGIIEKHVKPFAASHARDALCKALYNRMFDQLLLCVNRSLASGGEPMERSSLWVGVLDIYGFENMTTNGFEQLLINYANERLQALFNKTVFESERAAHEAEGVPWSGVVLPDNSATLSLLESRSVGGVFPRCDEECLLGEGSDTGLVSKLHRSHSSHPSYADAGPSSPWRGSPLDFCIRHFAGYVQYTADGFVETNRDTLQRSVLACMRGSSHEFVRALFSKIGSNSGSMEEEGASAGGRKRRESLGGGLQQTVATRFREEMDRLTSLVAPTKLQFVRCIKSNPSQLPGKMHGRAVLEQLQNAGVMAALDMRRAGFPSRLSHSAFLQRVCTLMRSTDRFKLLVRSPTPAVVTSALTPLVSHPLVRPGLLQVVKQDSFKVDDLIRVGRTMVFMRSHVLQVIDAAVRKQQHRAASTLVRWWRRVQAHLRLIAFRAAVRRLQAQLRGMLARRRVAAQALHAELQREFEQSAHRFESVLRAWSELEDTIRPVAKRVVSSECMQEASGSFSGSDAGLSHEIVSLGAALGRSVSNVADVLDVCRGAQSRASSALVSFGTLALATPVPTPAEFAQAKHEAEKCNSRFYAESCRSKAAVGILASVAAIVLEEAEAERKGASLCLANVDATLQEFMDNLALDSLAKGLDVSGLSDARESDGKHAAGVLEEMQTRFPPSGDGKEARPVTIMAVQDALSCLGECVGAVRAQAWNSGQNLYGWRALQAIVRQACSIAERVLQEHHKWQSRWMASRETALGQAMAVLRALRAVVFPAVPLSIVDSLRAKCADLTFQLTEVSRLAKDDSVALSPLAELLRTIRSDLAHFKTLIASPLSMDAPEVAISVEPLLSGMGWIELEQLLKLAAVIATDWLPSLCATATERRENALAVARKHADVCRGLHREAERVVGEHQSLVEEGSSAHTQLEGLRAALSRYDQLVKAVVSASPSLDGRLLLAPEQLETTLVESREGVETSQRHLLESLRELVQSRLRESAHLLEEAEMVMGAVMETEHAIAEFGTPLKEASGGDIPALAASLGQALVEWTDSFETALSDRLAAFGESAVPEAIRARMSQLQRLRVALKHGLLRLSPRVPPHVGTVPCESSARAIADQSNRLRELVQTRVAHRDSVVRVGSECQELVSVANRVLVRAQALRDGFSQLVKRSQVVAQCMTRAQESLRSFQTELEGVLQDKRCADLAGLLERARECHRLASMAEGVVSGAELEARQRSEQLSGLWSKISSTEIELVNLRMDTSARLSSMTPLALKTLSALVSAWEDARGHAEERVGEAKGELRTAEKDAELDVSLTGDDAKPVDIPFDATLEGASRFIDLAVRAVQGASAKSRMVLDGCQEAAQILEQADKKQRELELRVAHQAAEEERRAKQTREAATLEIEDAEACLQSAVKRVEAMHLDDVGPVVGNALAVARRAISDARQAILAAIHREEGRSTLESATQALEAAKNAANLARVSSESVSRVSIAYESFLLHNDRCDEAARRIEACAAGLREAEARALAQVGLELSALARTETIACGNILGVTAQLYTVSTCGIEDCEDAVSEYMRSLSTSDDPARDGSAERSAALVAVARAAIAGLLKPAEDRVKDERSRDGLSVEHDDSDDDSGDEWDDLFPPRGQPVQRPTVASPARRKAGAVDALARVAASATEGVPSAARDLGAASSDALSSALASITSAMRSVELFSQRSTEELESVLQGEKTSLMAPSHEADDSGWLASVTRVTAAAEEATRLVQHVLSQDSTTLTQRAVAVSEGRRLRMLTAHSKHGVELARSASDHVHSSFSAAASRSLVLSEEDLLPLIKAVEDRLAGLEACARSIALHAQAVQHGEDVSSTVMSLSEEYCGVASQCCESVRQALVELDRQSRRMEAASRRAVADRRRSVRAKALLSPPKASPREKQPRDANVERFVLKFIRDKRDRPPRARVQVPAPRGPPPPPLDRTVLEKSTPVSVRGRYEEAIEHLRGATAPIPAPPVSPPQTSATTKSSLSTGISGLRSLRWESPLPPANLEQALTDLAPTPLAPPPTALGAWSMHRELRRKLRK